MGSAVLEPYVLSQYVLAVKPRHTFLVVDPFPQISVHLDVTDKESIVGCSLPWSSVEAHLLTFQGAGPGCKAVGCCLLLHSLHCTSLSQFLVKWLDDAQHLNQMSLR